MIFHIAFICNGFSSFVFCFSFSFICIWMPARMHACVCVLCYLFYFDDYYPICSIHTIWEKCFSLFFILIFFFWFSFLAVRFFLYMYISVWSFPQLFVWITILAIYLVIWLFNMILSAFYNSSVGKGVFLSHIHCFSSVYLFILLNFQFEMKTGLICIGMNRVNAFDIANCKGQF